MADVEKVDALKEQAIEMLSSLIASATQAGEFIKGQIPLVIQELLTFHTALYVLYAVICAALCAATAWSFRWCMRKNAADEWDSYMPGVAFSAMGCVATGLFTLFSVVKLLKITLAPRVWLIEYAAGLVR